MTGQNKISRDYWGFIFLFALFLAVLFYTEQVSQEHEAQGQPSSFIAQPEGTKALFLLLESLDFHVDRYTKNWAELSNSQSLLIVIEPQSRPVAKEEIAPLRQWIQKGGSVFYIVTSPPRALDPHDTVLGDLAIISGANQHEILTPLKQVISTNGAPAGKIAVQSPVRLRPAPTSPYQIFLRDTEGALMVEKNLGRGKIYVVADQLLATNQGIREADNALFLAQIAAQATDHSGGKIVFDEYHHGVGFSAATAESADGVLQNLPRPLRLAFLQALCLTGVLIYNGNRRFGRAKTMHPEQHLRRANYIGSMAKLYRRAQAGDIAILTLYQHLAREIRSKWDVPPNLPIAELTQQVSQRLGIEESALSQIISRCDEVAAGARISEIEMQSLALKLEHIRKEVDLVGIP